MTFICCRNIDSSLKKVYTNACIWFFGQPGARPVWKPASTEVRQTWVSYVNHSCTYAPPFQLRQVRELIHMLPATEYVSGIQTMSYLHKKEIFIVTSLILGDVLFTRAMQKDFDSIILGLLCFMNWYSLRDIRILHCIRTRLHRIRTVVKFYNHTSGLRYGCRPMRCL